VKLTCPGDTVILHGRQVEHCVTKLENEGSERITLIMSLVDIENSPENVELNLIKDKINKYVIKDWLQWHTNFNTKSPDFLLGELLSKL
jgi:predicted NACHT family NTPase